MRFIIVMIATLMISISAQAGDIAQGEKVFQEV